MLYDFMIYYYKDKLNSADRSSRCSNYMNENEESNITIIRLILILLNKLYLNKLKLKELVIASLKADEQIGAIDSVFFIKSLT